MVSVDKFFIYGGGRWREVDTGSGRIDGWGKAKFLIARGGKLQAARSRPVLSALRALAEKKPSAAKEGLQLPYKYPSQRCPSRERVLRVGCEHCQCCHHTSTGTNCNSKSENKASIAIQCDKVDPLTQSTQNQNTNKQAQTNQDISRDTSKRKRDSSSSEELFQRKVITVATVHSPRNPQPKRRRTTSIRSPRKVGSKNRQSSTSSEENQAVKKSPRLKLRRPGPLKQKRSSSKEKSPIFQSKLPKYLQHKSKIVKRNENFEKNVRPTRKNTSIVISSDESDFKTSKSKRQKTSKTQRSSSTDIPNRVNLKNIEQSSTDEPIHKPGPKKTKSSTNNSGSKRTTEEQGHRPGSKRAPGPSKKPQSQESENGYQESSSQNAPKELVIDERDVEILRLFLQKHYDDEELLRFDTDDAYKKLHFYQINPLVMLERCPRIAKMIRADAQRSLVDFASKLGLRSVSEVSSIKPKRYKTRRREERNRSKSDSETEDKENERPLVSRKKESKKVLKESITRNKPKDVKERDRKKDNTMDTVELSSASETENGSSKPEVKKPPPLKKAKTKVAVSTKRATFKEYSNLEDHAIVSWVSVGGRASSVNGNRLWRQLQEQFQRLTGKGRTWHSLRNRYLRYILPRLSSLSLPPSQQSRLRAAAATGELKARRKEPRRNSMFKLPPRGASSRRPPAFRVETEEEETVQERKKMGVHTQGRGKPDPPRASPLRYSDITRQFAQRHRAQNHSSDRSSVRSKDDESRRKSPSNKRSPRNSSRVKSASPRNQSLSPRRKSNRRKFPSESSGDNFETRKSQSQSPNRRTSSDTSSDDSSGSGDSLSEPNRRQSNRHKSVSESNRRSSSRRRPNESIRINSPSESNGRDPNRNNSPSESNRRRSNRHISPSELNSRNANRTNSPSESRRRQSSRNNSPIESNRRKSNRHKSPSELNSRNANKTNSPIESNGRNQNRNNSPSESNRRKSNRHKSPRLVVISNANRTISPSESNIKELPDESNRRKRNRINSPSESNRHKSPSESNRRRSNRNKSPSESFSNSLRRRSNRHKSPVLSKRRTESNNDSSPSRLRNDLSTKPSPMKPRTRKLFNPKAVL